MNVETMADENGNTKFNGYLKNAQIDWKGKGFFCVCRTGKSEAVLGTGKFLGT